jgi:putative N6-adenine-specific DNA methylase
MCGAGTFSLEAALIAKSIAPGMNRDYAFMQWPAFRPQQWNHIKNSAARKIIKLERPVIWASDTNAAACTRLLDCISQNGLDDAIQVGQADFFSLHPDEISNQPGLIVLNPPYGRRLPAEAATEGAYQRIAAKLRQDFNGWKAALLVPDERLARKLNLSLNAFPLAHGGLKLILLTGTIKSKR